jgi:DNA-binding transcriptional LysR family regulator
MELRQLRYFVAIADGSSFTKASETLSIAQPALSAQIHKLEEELGAPLFVRTKRGITLTETGTAVLAEARKTVAAADSTVRAAALAGETAAARLIMAYTPIFPFFHVARIIRSLRRERPGAHIELREMWSPLQCDALASGAVDFAFVRDVPGHPVSEGIVRVPMAEELWTVAVPSGDPLASRRHVEFGDLARSLFIMPSPTFGETVRDDITAACRQAGFEPRVVQEVSDVRIMLGLVSAGLGITVLSSAARNVRVRGVTYISLSPKVVMRFSALYRRGFGGRGFASILSHLQEFSLE